MPWVPLLSQYMPLLLQFIYYDFDMEPYVHFELQFTNRQDFNLFQHLFERHHCRELDCSCKASLVRVYHMCLAGRYVHTKGYA